MNLRWESSNDWRIINFNLESVLYFIDAVPIVSECLSSTIPGKSFGLKFISNQSDLFQNLYPSNMNSSDSMWKKFSISFVQIGKKTIRLNPRLWIRMNPDQFFNPNESEIGLIRIDSDWKFSLNHSDLGFIPIGRLELSRIEFWLGLKISDSIGLRRIDF